MAEENLSFDLDILLATYNGERYVAEQVQSLLGQETKLTYRIVVSDDGSSDGTSRIVAEFARRHGDRVFVLPTDGERLGPTRRFEVLLRHSTAPYVMLCDQDDVWDPDKIELSWQHMRHAEGDDRELPVLVHTNLRVVDRELRVLLPRMYDAGDTGGSSGMSRLLVYNTVTGCTLMMNRSLVELALPFPAPIVMHDWWLGLLARACGELVYHQDPTLSYRQHGANAYGFDPPSLALFLKKLPTVLRAHELNTFYRRAISQAQAVAQRVQHVPGGDPRAREQVDRLARAGQVRGLALKVLLLRGGYLWGGPVKRLGVLARIR